MALDEATQDLSQLQPAVSFKIPPLIKRNTILLALSQAFVGAGMQMVPALGAILVVQLLGSASLAGIGTSMIGISRFVISYPLGKLMDTHGRKLGLLLGLVLGAIGAVLTGLSPVWHSFPLFLIGMLVFGMGMGAAQQLRLAAADMYPPARRAEGLGYVLTGTLLGAMGAPLIISTAQVVAPSLGVDPIALPWLFVPAVIVPAICLVFLVRPDPKEIAVHLERYYPGYRPAAQVSQARDAGSSAATFLRRYPLQVAFVASLAVHGNMAMIMVMTSLALNHYGHDLPAISISVAIHVMGMFGLSLPLGKLTDRFGRRNLLLVGVIITAVGSVLVPASPDYWIITAGTFMVGVGWSCVNVAATTVIADMTGATERGRAIGTNDTFSNASAVVLPLIGGPMVELFGLQSIGVVGVLVMLVPFVMLLRLRELRPGNYLEVLGTAV